MSSRTSTRSFLLPWRNDKSLVIPNAAWRLRAVTRLCGGRDRGQPASAVSNRTATAGPNTAEYDTWGVSPPSW